MSKVAKLGAALIAVAGENDEVQGVKTWLDTGFPPLNKAISGKYGCGLPVGRMIEMFGPESSGKCLTADTMLLSEHGMLTIEELYELEGYKATCVEKQVKCSVGLVNEDGEIENTSHLVWNGKRKYKTITTKSGIKLNATHRHPIRVMNDRGQIVWRHADKIAEGDKVPVMRGQNIFGKTGVSSAEARFIGYMVADGSLSNKNSIRFSNSDEEVIEDFAYLVKSIFSREIVSMSHTDPNSKTIDHYVHDTKLRRELVSEYGLDYVTAASKSVPLCIRMGSSDTQRSFVKAYFELECHVDPGKQIEVVSASRKLLSQVQLMLLNFGVVSSFSKKIVKGYEQDYWRLSISGSDYDLYGEKIGFSTSARLASYTRRASKMERTYSDVIPNMGDILRELFESSDTDREASEMLTGYMESANKSVGYKRLEKICAYFSERENAFNVNTLNYLQSLIDHNYFYDEVLHIDDGEAPTFDVALPETHSFWSNGFVSHNTAIATNVMKNAQQIGGIAMFNDHERSFDTVLAEKLGLLVGPGDPWIFKTPETFESSVTDTIKIARKIREESLIEKDAPIVVVFDSLASMIPKSKMAKDVDEQGMNDSLALAKATSSVFPVLSQMAQKYNMLILILNQVRLKPGVMFGDPTTTPGGEAPKFYASVRIQLGRKRIKNSSGDIIGQAITANVIKNKVSAPFKSTVWNYMFLDDGTGKFDVTGGLIDHMKDKGLIETKSNRIVWGDKTYPRGQLVNKIDDEGLIGDLMSMLPKDSE